MNNRVYNFSAGPGVIFEDVLKKAADEMMNQNGSGMSVMEMSHRSKWFEDIINGAEALLREVMSIPDNYKVLFLQGGASSQFAMIPMNLKKNGKADYIQTGVWAKKSFQEAKKFIDARVVASSEDKTYTYNGFTVNSYPLDGKDYVMEVVVNQAGIPTSKGVSVGDPVSKVTEAYGDNYKAVGVYYSYDAGNKKSLQFLIENDVVTEIDYFYTV